MTRVAVIDEKEIQITPVFKMMNLENIPKSETAGYPVMEMKEMVEIRFAGSKNYAPEVPTDSFWKREGNQVYTYAERWPEQYRAFKEGNPQEANGTPLEMLRPHGVTPEQLSLCRALRIYSIEALHHMEGPGVKALGMNGNKLKAAAREFMAERSKTTGDFTELETLRAQIAELQGQLSTRVPETPPTSAEVEKAIEAADAAYLDMSDAQIKDEIAELNDGKRPQGNPSRATLISMHKDLVQAA